MSTEEAWNAYADELLDYLQSKVRTQDEAEDLRQEIFLKAHAHLPELREQNKVLHWLRTVARNVVIDHWKAQNRRMDPVELKAIEEDLSIGQFADRCVRNMIGSLPETYRVPLKLSDIDGVSQKQIAQQLDLSYSGAKSRVQRGREMLREAIEACCKPVLNARNEIVDAACMREGC